MVRLLVLPALLAAAGCGESPCDGRLPSATGYFRVASRCGHALLVTPEGQPFYSAGVNHVSWDGDFSPSARANPYADAVRRRYGDEESWAAATAARLRAWGFNTIGAWSSASLRSRMPYTLILNLAQADWQSGRVPDYFAPEWAAGVEQRAAELIAGRAGDPNLVGYFLDNELRWGPDWRALRHLLEDYLLLPAAAPGRRRLLALLMERHGDIVRFNRAWGTAFASFEDLAAARSLPSRDLSAAALADRSAFLTAVAERYFSVTTAAVRAQDPNHLLLGVRFVAPLTPKEVVAVAGRHVDVVSVNAYEYRVPPAEIFDPEGFGFVAEGEGPEWLRAFHALSGRPLLITEFGFRAADSGLPNSYPPFYPTLATQEERADRLSAYVARCRATRYIVGHHWFEYTDQPATGRFDGENNNWGLVNVADDPYEVLTARSAALAAE